MPEASVSVIVKPGPTLALQDRVVRRGRAGESPAKINDESETPKRSIETLYATFSRSGFHARNSAPKRAASASTTAVRSRAASSSASVRSGDWNVTAKAIDFRPGPTCSPR